VLYTTFAAEAGNPAAQTALGWYWHTQGDDERARRWYYAAAATALEFAAEGYSNVELVHVPPRPAQTQ